MSTNRTPAKKTAPIKDEPTTSKAVEQEPAKEVKKTYNASAIIPASATPALFSSK